MHDGGAGGDHPGDFICIIPSMDKGLFPSIPVEITPAALSLFSWEQLAMVACCGTREQKQTLIDWSYSGINAADAECLQAAVALSTFQEAMGK